jgi:DNA replication protein DnaC
MNETATETAQAIIATAMEMGTESEIQAAERRRQERAKQVQIARVPKCATIEDFDAELKAAEERFKAAYFERVKTNKTTINAEHEAKERLAREDQVRLLFRDMRPPPRHARKQWTDLDFTGEWAQKLTDWKAKIGTGFLLALVGTYGNGKTQFAVEILREASQQLRTGLFITATAFFMDIKAAYKDKTADAEKDVVARYCKPQVLVIDEMSKRGETEWENRLLFHLINERYNHESDTLMIVNQEPEQFEESVGPALARRITEAGGMIDCKWKAFV